MTPELPDFEAIYRGEPIMEGVGQDLGPPWDIGEPQPPIAALHAAGEISSEVLDAGCGTGETALFLAEHGYRVAGVDAAATALARAQQKASARELAVDFQLADVTRLQGCDGRFATVVDSTLLHSLPLERRSDYLRAMHRSTMEGAALHVLCFSELLADQMPGPHRLSEPELRDQLTGCGWRIDGLQRSSITARLPQAVMAELDVGVELDGMQRALLPAWRCRATRV